MDTETCNQEMDVDMIVFVLYIVKYVYEMKTVMHSFFYSQHFCLQLQI